jgi:hypothetical protein
MIGSRNRLAAVHRIIADVNKRKPAGRQLQAQTKSGLGAESDGPQNKSLERNAHLVTNFAEPKFAPILSSPAAQAHFGIGY